MTPALFLAAAAASAPLSCPLTLPRETVAVRAPPQWHGYVPPDIIRLTGFGLLGGAPETLSYLAPTASTRSTVARSTITWRLDADTPRWLYCTYDDSAAIQIARPLPSGGTVCTIAYRKTRQDGITDMAASCR
jgi:hypothetical protein